MKIKIGTILTLEPTYTERVEKYRCKVVEQIDHIIFIDYPINTVTKKTAYLVDGAQFRASFHNDDNLSFAFNTEVLGRKVNNIPMIMLSCPPDNEFIKIQRREFVRVTTTVDVAVQFNNQFSQFVTADISAGGLALKLVNDAPFQAGDRLHLTIVLPYSNGEIRYVLSEANVVRIFQKDQLHLASLQFIDTDDIDKQFLVRFCFERQLLIRKKEYRI